VPLFAGSDLNGQWPGSGGRLPGPLCCEWFVGGPAEGIAWVGWSTHALDDRFSLPIELFMRQMIGS